MLNIHNGEAPGIPPHRLTLWKAPQAGAEVWATPRGGRQGRCREPVRLASDPSHQPGKACVHPAATGQGESHSVEKAAHHPGSGGAVASFYP